MYIATTYYGTGWDYQMSCSALGWIQIWIMLDGLETCQRLFLHWAQIYSMIVNNAKNNSSLIQPGTKYYTYQLLQNKNFEFEFEYHERFIDLLQCWIDKTLDLNHFESLLIHFVIQSACPRRIGKDVSSKLCCVRVWWMRLEVKERKEENGKLIKETSLRQKSKNFHCAARRRWETKWSRETLSYSSPEYNGRCCQLTGGGGAVCQAPCMHAAGAHYVFNTSETRATERRGK